MGYDCGFDIYPRLEPTEANQITYRRFLDEVINKYKDVKDEQARHASGRVLSLPGEDDDDGASNADAADKSSVRLLIGECPEMPVDAGRCDYFLRFSSKVSGELTAPEEWYLRSVHNIARKHFGGERVCWWHEMRDTGDERQWGRYTWDEVL
ncbi:hypothetical protein PT974_02932 [Cladobotryum mycophilum]|uniref:Uncharacterized protein n=1 Tax=Cladobotryum mycophilum TaxID=491253 RepID=A0ABR0SZL7_9HYPO